MDHSDIEKTLPEELSESESLASQRRQLAEQQAQLDKEREELRREREKLRAMSEKPPEAADKKKAKKARQEDGSEDSGKFMIGNFIATFFLTVFVIIAVGLVALKLLGINAYYVASGSMEPTYPVYSIVFSRKVDPSTIRVGDTITYALNDENYVTHRVIEKHSSSRTFVTKCDNNNVEDSAPVKWDNVMGKVVFSVPFGGKVLKVIVAPENRVMFITIVIVLLAGTLLWGIIERIVKKKKAKKKAAEEQEALDVSIEEAPVPDAAENGNKE